MLADLGAFTFSETFAKDNTPEIWLDISPRRSDGSPGR